MDNEVVIHVRSENNVKPGFDAARADAHKTATDIEGDFKASGKRAGDAAGKGISDGIKKDSDKLGKDVGKGLLSGVTGSLPKMAANISSEFSAIASQAVPILAGIGVAAAPLIGATLSAAIIGGAGVGGVIGGVMLASRDRRVAAAGVALGNTINSQLTRDATPFIQPTLNAIGMLQKAFDANDSHIQNIFKNSARYVEPLTQGLTGLISGLVRGLDSLTSKAGPVIGALSKGLTEVGNSLGDMFTQISGQSEGAAAALGDIFGAISGIIQVLGPLLAGLTAVYGALSKIGVVKGLFVDLLGPIGMVGAEFIKTGDAARKTGSGTFGAAKSMDAASSATKDLYANLQSTTASMDSLRASAHALTDQNNDLYSSTTDVASAMAEASKKIKENGKDLRLNTQHGRDNRAALSSVAGALQKNYDAYVKVNGVGPKSAALADNLRNKFVSLAQKAGLSASAARNLANQLLSIPSSRTTKITANAAQALEAAREVRRAISSVQSKTVTLTIARRVTGSSASDSALQSAIGKQNAHGGIMGAATGATSSGFTWVGEQGPELVSLAAGTRVLSNPDSMRLAGPDHRPYRDRPRVMPGLPGGYKSGHPGITAGPGSGGGGGSSGGGGGGYDGGEITINLIMDGKTLVTALVDPMRNFVRTSFGGSVQAAYGRG